jgi:hypothetical protein
MQPLSWRSKLEAVMSDLPVSQYIEASGDGYRLAARGNSQISIPKHVTSEMFWASIWTWRWEPGESGSGSKIYGSRAAM